MAKDEIPAAVLRRARQAALRTAVRSQAPVADRSPAVPAPPPPPRQSPRRVLAREKVIAALKRLHPMD